MTAFEEMAEAAWGRILPFLRPIEALIRDPDISDIMINGEQAVFFEKDGRIEHASGVTIPERSLQVAARNIARALGDEISEEKPVLDSRLPDGSRVAIVLSPVSVGGTAITIRKFQNKRYNAQELVRIGTLTTEALLELQNAVLGRQNILISGGTGSGKTTLLNALAAFIPDEERIIVIEDTSEIQIDKPHLVRFEERKAQPDWPAVTIRELLRASLRMRPDRILLGEVRGGEAFDFLQALNTGHSGTLSTIHANSAAQSLTRFTTCVMMSGVELPHKAVRSQIGDALHLLVHIERRQGKRYVTEVLRIKGYDPAEDRYDLETVYEQEDARTRRPLSYIRDNFEPGDRLAVILLNKRTENVIQRIASAEKIAADDFQAWLRFQNANGHEIYVSMNALAKTARGRTKADVETIRHVYLDFDDDGTAAVEKLLPRDDLPKPNYLINTSPDKWQVVWKVRGFGKDQAEHLQRALVREMGADPAATDCSRVLRLPGFYNHKYSEPFRIASEKRSEETYGPEHFPNLPEEGRASRSLINRRGRLQGRVQCRRRISQSERDWAYAKRALARGTGRASLPPLRATVGTTSTIPTTTPS